MHANALLDRQAAGVLAHRDLIDVEHEHLLTASEAARHPALRNARNGKAAHIGKIHRLFTHGVRGADGRAHRLPFVKTPTGRMTSKEAILRFVRALTYGGQPPATETQTTACIRRSQNATDRELDDAGIC